MLALPLQSAIMNAMVKNQLTVIMSQGYYLHTYTTTRNEMIKVSHL